jgi:2-polyprenyl-3-methyl-5-hydroxy-6-metoxy-1,4-benzoquinol methylase
MEKKLIDEMIKDLKPQTSGGGTHGIYQDIIDQNKNTIVKGIRSSIDRINLIGHKLNGSILDIGCNIGSISRYYTLLGNETIGIDINPQFIKWAKKINPEGKYFCIDLNNELNHKIFNKKYDNIFLLAVWDYFQNPGQIKYLLKNISSGFIFIESHADGEVRIENDIIEKGRTYKSWNHILNNVLKINYEFLGFTDNKRRALWKCYF